MGISFPTWLIAPVSWGRILTLQYYISASIQVQGKGTLGLGLARDQIERASSSWGERKYKVGKGQYFLSKVFYSTSPPTARPNKLPLDWPKGLTSGREPKLQHHLNTNALDPLSYTSCSPPPHQAQMNSNHLAIV